MEVAIVNYGMGNLGSVLRAVQTLGYRASVVDAARELHRAPAVILPGVGSFLVGMARLQELELDQAIHEAVRDQGKPLLGICLGMQLLADYGTEGGGCAGLGLIPGRVDRLDVAGCGLRVPHVGWNGVHRRAESDSTLLKGIPDGSDFYFVHSYLFTPADSKDAVAFADYGVEVTAVIERERTTGVQFHPEKSSRAGLLLLQNFLHSLPC